MSMSVNVVPMVVRAPAPVLGERSRVTGILNLLLVDSFTIYLRTKQLSAQMMSLSMRRPFLLLEDQARQILEMADGIVERICAIDPSALGEMSGLIPKNRSIVAQPQAAPDFTLAAIRSDNLILVDRLRDVKLPVIQAGDLISVNLIDFWIDEAQRRAAFLQEASQD